VTVIKKKEAQIIKMYLNKVICQVCIVPWIISGQQDKFKYVVHLDLILFT